MLLSTLENLIVDDMTHKQVRYLHPVLAKKSTGRVKQIYQQIRRDFQLVPPLTMFSPSPRLLAGVWSIWRESQFAKGTTPRATLEAVSAAISRINECPYCVDAHTGMLHASSKHDVVNAIFERNNTLINDTKTRQIVEWALATKTPDAKILKSPPFNAKEAPEIIGTAIVYHFVNRMVNIFLETSPLPIPVGAKKIRKIAVRLFGATLAKRIINRQVISGDSIKFITHAELPDDLHWANPNDHISAAYASFSRLIEQLGESSLSGNVRQLVKQQVDLWQGEDMGFSQNWLEELMTNLDESDQHTARLALLAAIAPYQVDKNIINRFREIYPDDEALLHVTAWASFTAARRIGRWLC
jgi:AhpD family alkylhydroperoxidase